MIRRNPIFLIGLSMAAMSLLFVACDDDGDDNGGTTDVVEDTTPGDVEQDVPEQDVPEQDVPEDDTVTGAGACTNAADLAIITTEPTTEQCADCPGGADCDTPPQKTVTAIAQDCGLGCIAAPDAVECARPCIEEDAGTTSECSTCYAENVACAIDKCLAECATDPGSQACGDCRAENCNDAFFTCSGLAPEDTGTAGCQ